MSRESVSWRGGYDFDHLQQGVVAAGALQLSAISIAAAGALTFTSAAGGWWGKDSTGALIRNNQVAQTKTLTPTVLPAASQYKVIGVEIDPAGNITLVNGTATATQLNSGLVIASNSPAVTAGRMRIGDIAIFNNAGTYQFSDHTTTATQGVNWIDRRPWARGYYRTTQGDGSGDAVTSSTTLGLGSPSINNALPPQRVEISQLNILRIDIDGEYSTAAAGLLLAMYSQGVNLIFEKPLQQVVTQLSPQAFSISHELPIAPGSYLIQFNFASTVAAQNVYINNSSAGSYTLPTVRLREEIIQSSASNGNV